MEYYSGKERTVQVKRLPYHGPKEAREEGKGWLKIWWIAEMPGQEPPSRRQYCSRRQVQSILKYWQQSCFCLMKHEYVPDVAVSALEKILEPSPLDRVLGL